MLIDKVSWKRILPLIVIAALSFGCLQWVPYQPNLIQVRGNPDQLFDAAVRVFARRGWGIHVSNSRGRVLETDLLRGRSFPVYYRMIISDGKMEIFTGCPELLTSKCKDQRPEGTTDIEEELASSIVAEANSLASSPSASKVPRDPAEGKVAHQENCPPGMTVSADTERHCCWPAQAWNPKRNACVGIPRCQKGFRIDAKKQICLLPDCRGERLRAPDGIHCCWPGQTFARSRNACVGVPEECPDGMNPNGEDCVGTPRCPLSMAYIPGGSFQTLDSKEKVSLGSFCIDRFEVTVEAYQRCIQNGVCTRPAMDIESKYCNIHSNARGNHPINCITAEQANSYCNAQGKRLPLDEEWEWAARSAGATIAFPWGDSSPTKEHMCWDENRGANTCKVGSFPTGVSRQGVHDLSGNVNEWTIYKGKISIVRGGAWDTGEEREFRNDHRKKNPDQDWGRSIGFRCSQNALRTQ